MAERRKNKKKKDQPEHSEVEAKPSKEEYAIAKYLRQKLPVKKVSLLGHKVEYFIASKAIDCLLDSKWAKQSDAEESLFSTRDSVVMYLDTMLQHKFFHRAQKIYVTNDMRRGKKKGEDKENEEAESSKDSKKSKDTTTEKESKKSKTTGKEKSKGSKKSKTDDEKDSKVENDEDSKADAETKSKSDEKESKKVKKEKKKIKLDMHLKQLFLDGNEVYVWIYDPIPVRTWINGILMVVGAVLLCLFPLWPQVIRHYIYYLSIAAALFLVFIIGLAVIRLVVFVLIWLCTLGRHHLWLLPNLTEDVGFFESFWPLYQYEYKGKKKGEDDSKSKDKKTKDKEEEEDEKSKVEKEDEEEEEDNEDKSDSSSEPDKRSDHQNSESEGDSGDDNAKSGSGDNGFEMLDAEEEDKKNV